MNANPNAVFSGHDAAASWAIVPGVVIALACFVTMVLLLSHPRTRRTTLVLLAVLVAFAVLLMFTWVISYRALEDPRTATVVHSSPAVPGHSRPMLPDGSEGAPTPAEPAPPEPADEATAVAPTQGPNSDGRRETKSPLDENVLPPVAKELATSLGPLGPRPPLPAWVTGPDELSPDGGYSTKVSIGPYRSIMQCTSGMEGAVRGAVYSYVPLMLYQNRGGKYPLDVPTEFINNRIVREKIVEWREYSVGDMATLHVHLVFDRQVHDELRLMERARETQLRMAYVGVLGGLLLVSMGTVFAYLKVDTATKGYYTRRLMLVAAVALVGIVCLACMALSGDLVEPTLRHGVKYWF